MFPFSSRLDKAGVGLVATISTGAFLFCLYSGCQRAGQAPKANRGGECRVSFRMGEEWPFAEVCLTDASQMEELVLRPLREARRDPNPAEYAIFGTLTIISPNQSRETIVLFVPWGYYKRGGEYFVTDFSGLQAVCEETLHDATRRMESARAIEENDGKEKRKRGREK